MRKASGSSLVRVTSMLTTCLHTYYGIFVDTIFNHMTGRPSNNDTGGSPHHGIGGSYFTQYVYPGIYESQDFHYCGLEPNNDIVNYHNRLEVQTCQLVGLAEYVYISAFPKRLWLIMLQSCDGYGVCERSSRRVCE